MRPQRFLLVFWISLSALISGACGYKCDPTKSKAECLAVIVDVKQKQEVKESCGTYASQCFTDDDLKEFVSDGVPADTVASLKRDKDFREVILALKQMPSEQQKKILDSCRRLRRPTWTELGGVSCQGQTAAGAQAESMIATAVVDSTQELLKLSPAEIQKLGASRAVYWGSGVVICVIALFMIMILWKRQQRRVRS